MERRFQIEGHECRIVVVANENHDPANPKKSDHLFDTPESVAWVNLEAFFDGECVYGTNSASGNDFTASMNSLCGLLVIYALHSGEQKYSGGAADLIKDLKFG